MFASVSDGIERPVTVPTLADPPPSAALCARCPRGTLGGANV